MLTTIGQYITGKVVTAILVVTGGAALIWFWRHPEQLAAIWQTLKYAVAWMGFVVVLPWASWFLVRWVIAQESNRTAAMLLIAFVIADAIVAFCLIGRVRGLNMLTWIVLLLGFLAAAVYNFKVCDYLAERAEDSA